jgi:hypothetical protein
MTSNYVHTFASQGWQCPVCLAVMSPTFPTCFNCTGKTTTTTTTSAGITETLSLCKHGNPLKFACQKCMFPCVHEYKNEVLTSNPPQKQCKKCYEFFPY